MPPRKAKRNGCAAKFIVEGVPGPPPGEPGGGPRGADRAYGHLIAREAPAELKAISKETYEVSKLRLGDGTAI